MTDEAGASGSFTYDALDRLLRETYPDGRALSYTYDPGGNRTSRTDALGPTSYLYDAADRLVQAGTTSTPTMRMATGSARTAGDGTITSYKL